jgi:glutamyl-tRNA synthetase
MRGTGTGVWERGSEKEMDRVAQFERFGFVRIDSVGEKGCGVFYA